MADKTYLLPLWLRLWHWTTALLMAALAASGVSMHFAAPEAALIPFSLARDIHNAAGLSLAAVYAVFVIGNLATGNWREYAPLSANYWRRLVAQTRYYLWGIFLHEPNPHHPTPRLKFNALQSSIYGLVMYGLFPVLVATGLTFLYPELASGRLFGMDGLLFIAVTHSMCGFAIAMFTLGHIYLATTGRTPTAMIRTMVTGWHEG